ncbi:uncharacterized protein MKK02DRAFT_30655 [Dioszegia hungarica]|uniref:Uncharacterized protein n=1 Tax=Dioszegia hungarica TaxID=4972 RepID=A0AA38H484_9TREE|nr:uncharacterized protein MKK02DRAFT_30655 [Dioszegia hungarica]KAI9632109.1 hypothetical protein MKK02DRAFT_30655 [Dioszegia hungarica]
MDPPQRGSSDLRFKECGAVVTQASRHFATLSTFQSSVLYLPADPTESHSRSFISILGVTLESLVMKPFNKEFPSELWPLILRWLRNPTPLPSSRPPRSELAQPHLAQTVRVSKYFNSIVERLLYTHVISEDFPGLFAVPESAPGRRFTLTKSLKVEYCSKTTDVTYRTIFSTPAAGSQTSPEHSVWRNVGLSRQEHEAGLDLACEAEIARIHILTCRFQGELGGEKRSMADVLPRLETRAINSIYASEDDAYHRYERNIMDGSREKERMQVSVIMFAEFLKSGNLRHFCILDNLGPLSLPLVSYASFQGPPHTLSVHFSRLSGARFPVSMGRNIRWAYDGPPNADMREYFGEMSRDLMLVAKHRKALVAGPGNSGTNRPRPANSDVADVDIYMSSTMLSPGFEPAYTSFYPNAAIELDARALSIDKERVMVRLLGAECQTHMRKSSGLLDVVRWHPTWEAPICEACGVGWV